MDGNGRWLRRGGGIGRLQRRGGVGRWCWAVVWDCSGGVGRWRQKKNRQLWHCYQHYWSRELILQCWHQRWQGWHKRTHPMQGTYVGSNGNKIGILQWWWWWWWCGYNNSVDEARARGGWRRTSTGKARAMQLWCHDRSDKGEGKRLSKGTCWLSTQAGQKGYNSRAALENKKDTNRLGGLILYYLPPPLESAKTKHRQRCLRPLDEVLALGLGNAVAIAPVGASGCQRHGGKNRHRNKNMARGLWSRVPCLNSYVRRIW